MSQSVQGKKEWLIRLTSRVKPGKKHRDCKEPSGAARQRGQTVEERDQDQPGSCYAYASLGRGDHQLDPPPPYTPRPPSSTPADEPNFSVTESSVHMVGTSQATSRQAAARHQELTPPPTYDQPATSVPGTQASIPPNAQPPPTTASRTAEQDKEALEAVLQVHGWRRLWGPRPRTLSRALGRAALAGNEALVRALLDAGAAICELSPAGPRSAVHDALRGPEPGLALLLLDHECESAPRSAQSAATGVSAEEVADANVKRLLGGRDANRCTPLHLAAGVGATDVVGELLYLGAEVDAVDVFGRTPLHMAAKYRREEAMACLLDYQADVGMVDDHLWLGLEPEEAAELGDFTFVRQTLLHAVEEKNAREKKGMMTDGDEDGNTENGPEKHQTERVYPVPDQSLQAMEKVLARPGRQAWRVGDGYGRRNRQLSGPLTLDPRVTPGHPATPSLSPWPSIPQICPRPSPSTSSSSHLQHGNPSPRRAARKLPPSIAFSPQYVEWRKTCEKVQAEHRQQKERNMRAEIPS
ncbi:hypothetical protein QBC33DRAFT_599147 [Phialemonium atrogriseum]|uniref:Uncharacterized protein n=1 Tax=Phialemonium atrogriseum TaxID=1093897 RepID=A0AAJ0BS15_9PEZI|nr:uncharacterized protein QBC33DRAFT_599147 [Phialemonium atrogriseum]KAK1762992.1 hypothetical protein QBC33DRAFT_599147 [Phialemonium atrogriseum]